MPGHLLIALLLLPPLSVNHLCTIDLARTTVDQNGASFTVTGLSGIAWLGPDTALAVMDNSNHVVRLHVAIDQAGTIEASIVGGLTLARSGDYEAIAITAAGDIVLLDERTQTLCRFDAKSGSLLATMPLPAIYRNHRSNRGCEAFALTASGGVVLANEEALTSDGPQATPDHGSWVRLLRGDPAGAYVQFAYRVDAMPGPRLPKSSQGQSGLVALVPLPNGTLLAVERSLAYAGTLFETRFYAIRADGATDIRSLASLKGAAFTPLAKAMLYKGGHLNLEGLCVGPSLDAGVHCLLGIVDDGDPFSQNQLVVFSLSGLVQP